ncbi:MAG: aminotransferase class I/II-fold pyridoxal phosphate-dependent enzyme [Sarcina sp.]
MINLNSNENLYNPYKNLLIKILTDVDDLEINKYPNNDYLNLRNAYANYIDLSAENIIAGNGSDEMLDLIISTYIKKDDIVVTLDPDFSMYDYYVKKNEGILKKYKFNDRNFENNKFISFIKYYNPKIVIFSSPNNPTGIKIEDVESILSLNTFKVIIDEAYIEFSKESVIPLIKKYSNLIVTRTMSKAFGIASSRVGFLVSNKDEIEFLLNNKVPYNINTLSSTIAQKVLENTNLMIESVEKINENRERLYKILCENKINLNIEVLKSEANYLYLKGYGVEKIIKKLEKNNMKIRKFNNAIRITIGTKNIVDKIIEILIQNEV